eukprot:CAMPEP_0117434944 /NCGR_PEP_ID=MMETSP0759-20121206/217_1 /TAXON_ID=63605 /ORGANISM="Percolomonas cosmopolitus, Strain WS" /LENGTH=182 /DNA_ID=CAMNT_0005226457 /DNA_START=58 /DNA_END=606 /DNA_ORIENTATION=-
MKFSVNIDQSFIENARKTHQGSTDEENNKENAPHVEHNVNVVAQQSESTKTDKENKSLASHDKNIGDQSAGTDTTDKFATSNLLMDAIGQTKRLQKQSRIHLKTLQHTIEDASASHLQDQIDLVNSYAPNFKTPRYNCMNEYKGLEDCYSSRGGGVKCENIFKDFMRCYRDTRRQYFELREL